MPTQNEIESAIARRASFSAGRVVREYEEEPSNYSPGGDALFLAIAYAALNAYGQYECPHCESTIDVSGVAAASAAQVPGGVPLVCPDCGQGFFAECSGVEMHFECSKG